MTPSFRRNALIVVLAFLAALAGAATGCRMAGRQDRHDTGLHALLHRQMKLDAAQEAGVDMLEARFAVTRAGFDARLRTDNARLADAIEREHGYGREVAAAVDRSHHTMGALQKATLAHVFAMRQLMRPDQTATFDQVVVRALTAAS